MQTGKQSSGSEGDVCNKGGGRGPLVYLGFVAAAATLVGVGARVGDGHEAAQVAHVHLVGVGRLEQTLLQELGGAVGDLTITLHLTETQTAITGRRAEHDWLGEGREGV